MAYLEKVETLTLLVMVILSILSTEVVFTDTPRTWSLVSADGKKNAHKNNDETSKIN